jgi:polar amino acid transport system permease protein
MEELTSLQESLPQLLTGAIVTVQLTLCCVIFSLCMGIASVALQLSGYPVGYWLSRTYVSIMRGTPLLVQLFVVFFGLPLIGLKGQAFASAVLAIGFNSGAYVTEILRAAILAIPPGQVEAARTIGMSTWQIWQRLILPQAFVMSLPALTNEFTIVLKSTPLASVVAVTELTFTGQLIVSRTFLPTAILLTVAGGYVIVSLVFSQLSRWLERHYAEYKLSA